MKNLKFSKRNKQKDTLTNPYEKKNMLNQAKLMLSCETWEVRGGGGQME
jgi:hypothetical protein